MFDYFIDFLVVLFFLILSIFLWKISTTRKSKHNRLLFQSISLFVLFHLMIFPITYTFIINHDYENIRIDENIFINEKEKKLEEAKRIENEINSDYKTILTKKEINELLTSDKEALDSIHWQDINNKQLLFLTNRILTGKNKNIAIPGSKLRKSIDIYKLDGKKSASISSESDKNYLSEILKEHIIELDSKKNEITKEIERIESNSFWSYRQVLPYTINILFTSNFEPKSKSANIVYFIHNVLVVGFLFTLIFGSFQHFLEKKR